ncbi:hypothetical protein ElyMa_002271500 [Elysia marginata]|uniref:Uncharacterized protein n=1 Tax=Elysia marginata TaxID=1093978 RepID=A0AAV4G252_9GAST|nr:hypothetical protein ElyMa_002271500 [Elysia marginata]
MRKWKKSADKALGDCGPSGSRSLHDSNTGQDNAGLTSSSDGFSNRTDVRGEESPGLDQSMSIKLTDVSARTVGDVDAAKDTSSSTPGTLMKSTGLRTGVSGAKDTAPGNKRNPRLKSEEEDQVSMAIGGKQEPPERLNSVVGDGAKLSESADSAMPDIVLSCSNSPVGNRLDKTGSDISDSQTRFHGQRSLRPEVHPAEGEEGVEFDSYDRRIVNVSAADPVPVSDHEVHRATQPLSAGPSEYDGSVSLSLSAEDSSFNSCSFSKASVSSSISSNSTAKWGTESHDSRTEGEHTCRSSKIDLARDAEPSSSSSSSRNNNSSTCPATRDSEPDTTTSAALGACGYSQTSSHGKSVSAAHGINNPGVAGRPCRSPTTFERGGVGFVDPIAALCELNSDRRRVLGRCPCHTPDSGIGLLLDTILEELEGEDREDEDWSPRAEYDFGDSDEEDWVIVSPEGYTEIHREADRAPALTFTLSIVARNTDDYKLRCSNRQDERWNKNRAGFEPAPLAGTHRLARRESRRTDHYAMAIPNHFD